MKIFKICLLLITGYLTCYVYGGDYNYIYNCKLEDHVDEDGKLRPESKYKLFLCIQEKKKRRFRNRQSVTFEVASEDPLPTVTMTDEEDVGSNIFSISNVAPEDHSTNPTYVYSPIGLINLEENEIAVLGSPRTARASEDAMNQVMQRFQRSKHYRVGSAGSGENFDYEVSLGVNIPIKEIMRLRDTATRVIDRVENPPPPRMFRISINIYNYLTGIAYPTLKGFYLTVAGYMPIGLTAAMMTSIFYAHKIRESVAVYEYVDDPEFAGCLSLVTVDSSKLLYNMREQGLTSKLFTVRNTFGEIYNDTIVTAGYNAKLGISGQFREFLTPECRCPTCPSTGLDIGNNFENCDVSVAVDIDTMFIYWLAQQNGNLAFELLNNVDIPANINVDPQWNFRFDPALEVIGNFTGVKPLNIREINVTCGCNPCPPVRIVSSEYAGDTLVNFSEVAITTVITSAIGIALCLRQRYIRYHVEAVNTD